MAPILAAGLVGGAASLLGGWMSNTANAKTARAQMDFSSVEAEKNRDFQAQQSGTAHQREVTDLRAAGLNPILSGTGGMGASTSVGAVGQSAGFTTQNNLGEAVNSALAARRNVAEVKNMEATNINIGADTDKKMSERALNSVLYNRTLEETDRTRHQKHSAEYEAQIMSNSAKGSKIEGEIDTTTYGKILRYINRGASSAKGAASAIRNIKP